MCSDVIIIFIMVGKLLVVFLIIFVIFVCKFVIVVVKLLLIGEDFVSYVYFCYILYCKEMIMINNFFLV